VHLKIKQILIAAFVALLIPALAACTAPATSSTSEAAQPTVEVALVPTETPTKAPTEVAPTVRPLQDDTRPIEITAVTMEFGVGSPAIVEAMASGAWPDLCAQLASLEQQFDGARFEISLRASAADPACPPDYLGLPFRLLIPLNMVEAPAGNYTASVNGIETSFDWPQATAEPVPVENLGLTFAYIGADGNLWIADASGGPPRQLSSDATSMEGGGEAISYYFPAISSDGRYVAVRRDAGAPVSEGLSYTFSLQVYDSGTGEARTIYESSDAPPAGFAWKPGSHLLAYGVGAAPNYFTMRGGKPDPALTTGISTIDLDSGETSELVAPENGYSLLQPAWSPDGRFLSFDELVYMEGRGPFAYYDFENGQYITWDEPLGNYNWSPDGEQLVYDRLSYAPNGTERIFTRPRLDGAEQQLSPDLPQGYAFLPVYSPDGRMVAYLSNAGGPDDIEETLIVQVLASGELRELGMFTYVMNLQWSPDGKALILSSGPYDEQQIFAIDLASGEATSLVEGGQPSVAKP
jgi:hypothetical protein